MRTIYAQDGSSVELLSGCRREFAKGFLKPFQLQSGCNLAAFLKDLDAPVLLSASSMLTSASMQNHPSSRCPIGLGSMHIIHFSAVDSLRRPNIGPSTSWHIHISTSPAHHDAHLTPRQDQSAVWRSRHILHDYGCCGYTQISLICLQYSVQHPDK
ncbi:uncharacterized protein BDW70DRAFT_92827 [Aspergillus foveolatus]|uniref:uncharacterized protein n=1 Tax=Aspergillus foveolatus TaxID=210207 RepID=UPI003CCD9166